MLLACSQSKILQSRVLHETYLKENEIFGGAKKQKKVLSQNYIFRGNLLCLLNTITAIDINLEET